MNWYQKKANECYQKWEMAIEAGDQVKADYFMVEHLNYKEMGEASR